MRLILEASVGSEVTVHEIKVSPNAATCIHPRTLYATQVRRYSSTLVTDTLVYQDERLYAMFCDMLMMAAG